MGEGSTAANPSPDLLSERREMLRAQREEPDLWSTTRVRDSTKPLSLSAA